MAAAGGAHETLKRRRCDLKTTATVLAALVLTAAAAGLSGWPDAGRTEAAIHEIVAAYCSGGGVGVIDQDGFLEPPPIVDFGSQTFAKPVIASGAVDVGTLTITSKPNAKFAEGTSVFALSSANATHPSADHCPKNALP